MLMGVKGWVCSGWLQGSSPHARPVEHVLARDWACPSSSPRDVNLRPARRVPAPATANDPEG